MVILDGSSQGVDYIDQDSDSVIWGERQRDSERSASNCTVKKTLSISTWKIRKSAGLDGIAPGTLSYLEEDVDETFYRTMEIVWNHPDDAQDWKLWVPVPIFKKWDLGKKGVLHQA